MTKCGAATRRQPQAHPHPESLQRFLRGESSRQEKGKVVRHLLAGCPECFAVTRPVGGMAGSLEQELEVLEAMALRAEPNLENRYMSRAGRDEG